MGSCLPQTHRCQIISPYNSLCLIFLCCVRDFWLKVGDHCTFRAISNWAYVQYIGFSSHCVIWLANQPLAAVMSDAIVAGNSTRWWFDWTCLHQSLSPHLVDSVGFQQRTWSHWLLNHELPDESLHVTYTWGFFQEFMILGSNYRWHFILIYRVPNTLITK